MTTAAFDPAPTIARGVTAVRRTGAVEGDRLLVLLGNGPTTFGVLAAACLEGVVAVPLPPDLAAAEVRAIADDADPVAVLADPQQAPVADALRDRWRVHDGAPSTVAALPGTDPTHAWPRTRPMAYTSGTTGRRKGVHVGVQDAGWGEEVIADEATAFDHRHGDLHLVVSPLYHSGPFRHALVTALQGGRLAILPSFDASGWRRALRTIRPTSLFCVPTHLHRLAALDPDGGGLGEDLASLSLLAHAGAPCPRPLKERVLDAAPAGSVWEFYGSTEGQFTVCPPDVWQQAPGTVGRARAGRRLEVRDDAGGALPAGATGTVWCHVPDHARFRYWRDPDRTAQAWDGDAFTVGDLGRLDEGGRLTLAGRPGDLVISGGVNVYPAEVERHLLDLPGVAEAVAFGVPDEDLGERLVAAVVAWPGYRLEGASLREALRPRVRRAEVPRTVHIVHDLPRTPTGKIRRVGLAEGLTDDPRP